MPRKRERQFPSGIRDAEEGVSDRARLVRSAVVIRNDRRQLVARIRIPPSLIPFDDLSEPRNVFVV